MKNLGIFFTGVGAVVLLQRLGVYNTVMIAIILAMGVALSSIVSLVTLYLCDKYDEWKERPRVKAGPMPKTSPYR